MDWLKSLNELKIIPEQEGLTHINMYSQSRLLIGKMLSNFYEYEQSTEDGMFRSLEAYHCWLSLPEDSPRDQLRRFSGYKAKELGRRLIVEFGYKADDRFNEKVFDAMKIKMQHNSSMFSSAFENLPITHYYVYGGHVVDLNLKYPEMIRVLNEEKDRIMKCNAENSKSTSIFDV